MPPQGAFTKNDPLIRCAGESRDRGLGSSIASFADAWHRREMTLRKKFWAGKPWPKEPRTPPFFPSLDFFSWLGWVLYSRRKEGVSTNIRKRRGSFGVLVKRFDATSAGPFEYNNSCDNLICAMSANELKSARTAKGLTQAEAANRLGVSQPYVAMLESGERRLTRRLAQRVMRVYALPPTAVPPSDSLKEPKGASELAADLAALDYPGFSHLRPHRWTPKNPAEVLVAALAREELEPRLVEALPWLLLHYPTLDREWLVREAKVRDLQNRLGFVASLARRLADRVGAADKAKNLDELESNLERSRLAREDTLGASVPDSKRRWLQQNQSEDAKRWNVLTDWTASALRYA